MSYTTQNYAGLTGTAIYGFSTTTGYQATDNLGVDLSYLNGPFTAVFSAQRVRTAAVAPSTQQEMYLIDGAYDANLAKFCAAA